MIFVVTDHLETREALTQLIAGRGYNVIEVACGEALHKHLQFQLPSLIVLDCGMRDSFAMIATTRAASRTAPIPVIMFGDSDVDLRDKALLHGADVYVPKGSLDWVQLLAEIQRFVGEPPPRQ